jgi:chemotaxis protein MotB
MKSLDAIASPLESVPYDIRIEGHTDNMPIHTAQFDSNWELSCTRATHLAELFIEQHQFLFQQLSASGYAEYHPVASNATAEGCSQNCCVDIMVLPKISEDSEIDLKTPGPHMTPPAHNALGHPTDR